MFSRTHRAAALGAAVSLALLMASPAAAEEEDVIARVGEAEITESDLAMAQEGFAAELGNLPPDQMRSVLVDILIDMQILSQAAIAAGFDKTADFDRQMAFLRIRALRNAYVQKEVVETISDEQIAAAYEERIAGFEPKDEVRARHILVASEDEAKAVIAALDGGADFATLAQEKSTGPSGPNGGDLGYFSQGQMVPEFDAAVFALEAGTYSREPVQTQFGWHVIKVEDVRMTEPPSLESQREPILGELLRARFNMVISDLRNTFPVEIIPPAASDEADEAGEAAE